MIDRENAWEITTTHGTRIILDAGEEPRWMRIPVIGEDGRLGLHPLDGRWRRLLTAYPLDDREQRGEFGRVSRACFSITANSHTGPAARIEPGAGKPSDRSPASTVCPDRCADPTRCTT